MFVLCVVVIPVAAKVVAAPTNARLLLFQLITELQTGAADPATCSVELRGLIRMQTRGTGIYPSLAKLGKVSDIALQATTPMERGTVYALTANHAKGKSMWRIGIGNLSSRIEYIVFQVSDGSSTDPPISVTPGVTQPPVTTPGPAPPVDNRIRPKAQEPSTESTSCKMFPNLC